MDKTNKNEWTPSTALEEEIVSLQPGYDFIYGTDFSEDTFYRAPRPQSHMLLAKKQHKANEQTLKALQELPADSERRQKLAAIAKVQSIARTKPLHEVPTVDDWNNAVHQETEAIAMMRFFGMQPNIETPLREEKAICTKPKNKGFKTVKTKHGSLPVLLDEEFFKLKLSDDSSSATTRTTTERSFNSNGASSSSIVNDSDLIKFSSSEFDSLGNTTYTVDRSEEEKYKEISYNLLINSSSEVDSIPDICGNNVPKPRTLDTFFEKAKKNKKKQKNQQLIL